MNVMELLGPGTKTAAGDIKGEEELFITDDSGVANSGGQVVKE
ncbi:hypothetical protein [Neomoorella glycerini]|nr:hypothetical protein [Moorella glycerini]